MTWLERVGSHLYRWVLRAYPRSFQASFGGEMLETFRRELADHRARGAFPAVLYLLRALGGGILLGLQERLEGRRTGGGGGHDSFLRDLRWAVRSLARDPRFAFTAVLALGLGIGLTGAAFSITWGTLLRGLPFPDAEELVHFARGNEEFNSLAVTPHDYVAWSEMQRSFTGLAAYTEAIVNLNESGGFPARVEGAALESGAFSLLGVAPALGRTLLPEDDLPGGPDVVVLSHALWSGRYGGDPGILGREILLNDRPHTVVGVMPRGFGFPLAEELWIPLRLDLRDHVPGTGRLDAFGRLRPGITLEAARSEFQGISQELARSRPGTNAGIRAILESYTREYVGDDFASVVWALLGGATLVLLVACLNVANLMLVRGVRRAREMAIRISLGAGRRRLLRLIVAEGVVLAALAAVVGTPLAAAGVRWFAGTGGEPGTFQLAHGGSVPFWWDVTLDGTTLAFILLAALLTLLAAGVVPALRVWRTDPNTFLRDQTRKGSARTSPLTHAVVAGELAVALAVLSVAGVMAQSLLQVTRVDQGIRTQGITLARLALPDARLGVSEADFPDLESRRLLWEGLVTRLESLPGVQNASVATAVPFLRTFREEVRIAGRPPAGGGEEGVQAWFGVADPGFFHLLGVAALEGRLLGPDDRLGAEPVVVVNRSFALRHFPGGSPVGESLILRSSAGEVGAGSSDEVVARIVGVVPDLAMAPVGDEDPSGFYRPLAQAGRPNRTGIFDRRELRYAWVMVRPAPGGDGADALRTAVSALAPGLPLSGLQTLDRAARTATGQYRLYGTFYLVFGAAALFLAILGLYGVVAYAVGNRTHEVGIRIALGAGRRRVLGTVLRGVAGPVAAGLGAGLLLSLWVGDTLELVVLGAQAGDPMVLAGAVVLLALTAAVAALVPAHRATRIDPGQAFRAE